MAHPLRLPRIDPPGEPAWVMQLVLHVEKTDPPGRSRCCAAAGTAVVSLLDDARSVDPEQWAPPVQRWLSGRIRKHCRRARGVAWQRVQELPGFTATVGNAQCRAFLPCPMDDIPQLIGKLQLTGSELADPELAVELDPVEDGPVVVSICPEPFLPLGKAAAAAGHAAQLSAARMSAERRQRWRDCGFAVEVEHPDLARWRRLRAASQVEVVDGGLTVVPDGTTTALARWR